VGLALPAWAPVHESMATVLGEELDACVYPDWRQSQAHDVRTVCSDPGAWVLIAVGDDHRPVGFVAVAIDGSEGTGEIDMIAVAPPVSVKGWPGRSPSTRPPR